VKKGKYQDPKQNLNPFIKFILIELVAWFTIPVHVPRVNFLWSLLLSRILPKLAATECVDGHLWLGLLLHLVNPITGEQVALPSYPVCENIAQVHPGLNTFVFKNDNGYLQIQRERINFHQLFL
ncbi:hypothetical protein ACJX0J_026025, partial [Zea mays]